MGTVKSRNPSRRTVLKATGSAFATVAPTVGEAAAAPDGTVEPNVGFDAPSGLDAVWSPASEVVREFDHVDVVTVRTTERPTSASLERPVTRITKPSDPPIPERPASVIANS